MRSGRQRRRGLTLMEVLVAISLLSLLSVGILTALRMGVNAWEKTNSRLMLDRRIATANTILHAELEGIFPALGEVERPPVRGTFTGLLFQGESQSLRFVTTYSLEGGPRGGLRLTEIQVVQAERGKRVLLNELFYDGPRAAGRVVTGLGEVPETRQLRFVFAPIQARPSSFVIADELENGAFSYLLQDNPAAPPRWLPAWPRADELPVAVSIALVPRPDATGLLPVTVTVPIRATLMPL